MKSNRRFSFNDLSISRVISGLLTRLKSIPHSLAWQLQPYSKNNQKKIREYRNCHLGERCFIVANGPSLANTNLDLLQSEFSFGLNRIYLQFPKSSFRPTYFVAVNELVLQQFNHEIQPLSLPKFINWNQRNLFRKHDDQILYLKPRLVLQDYFESDISKPVVFGGTVTFVALQIAYYMGFREAILVGLDHNYVEKGTPNTSEIRIQSKDESHFDPNYFPKGIKWQLPDLYRSEFDYQLAKTAYEQDGRKILDATIGGKCQIFEKVEYESLFK